MEAMAVATRSPTRGHAAPSEWVHARRWLWFFAICRLGTALVAAGLLVLRPITEHDALLGTVAVVWGAWSVLVVALWPRVAALPPVWALDAVLLLGLVLAGGDWRSPFYLLAVSALVLPATALSRRQAAATGATFTVVYFAIALFTGIDWEVVQSTSRLESFSTHLLIPSLVVLALAHASRLLEDLQAERERSQVLALEAERRRIGWELHDSAKQRINAAHLVLSSLAQDGDERNRLGQALEELDAAGREMDACLTELRTTLGGLELGDAIARRAAELHAVSGVPIEVAGHAPGLPAHVAVHAFRVASEALSNAIRHADADRIVASLRLERERLSLAVTDDGRGMPADLPRDSSGLSSMDARAVVLGGHLEIGPGDAGRGTRVELVVPLLPGRSLRPDPHAVR